MPKRKIEPLGYHLLGNLVDANNIRMAVLEVEPDLTDVIPRVPAAVRDDFGRVGVLMSTAPITYRWVGKVTKAKAIECFAPKGKKVSAAVAKKKMA
jgi:hypothetical protein